MNSPFEATKKAAQNAPQSRVLSAMRRRRVSPQGLALSVAGLLAAGTGVQAGTYPKAGSADGLDAARVYAGSALSNDLTFNVARSTTSATLRDFRAVNLAGALTSNNGRTRIMGTPTGADAVTDVRPAPQTPSLNAFASLLRYGSVSARPAADTASGRTRMAQAFVGSNTGSSTIAYWTGGVDSIWNTVSSGQTNWSSDVNGMMNTSVPDSNTDVVFNATGATNLNTTLGQDFSISSLTFASNATSPVTIGDSSYTLTIGAGGVTTQMGSGPDTISSNVTFGSGDTTFTTNGSNPLTVSGSISGGYGLIKEGTGTLILASSNGNVYTGATTVNAGTLTVMAGSSPGNGSGALIVNNTNTGAGRATIVNLYGNPNQNGNPYGNVYVSNLSGMVSQSGVTSGTNTATINLSSGTKLEDFQLGDTTYQGVISGAGGFSVVDPGVLILSGANTYTGGTMVINGVLSGTTTSLQGDISFDGGVLDFTQSTSGTYAGKLSPISNGGVGNVTIGGHGVGGGTVTFTGNNAGFRADTTIIQGTFSVTTTSVGTGTISINNPMNASNATLDLGGGSGTLTNQISGTGNVTVGGNQSVNPIMAGAIITMTAQNHYAGGTTVTAPSSGTVMLSGNAASYGTGAITVNSGATVDYTQDVNGPTAPASNDISGAGSATFGGNATSANGTGGTINYTGQDNVMGGTTVASGTAALANTTGAAIDGPVTVAMGATLMLNADRVNGSTSDQIATAAPPAMTPTVAAVTLNGGKFDANGHSDGTINGTDPTTAAVTSSMGALSLGTGTTSTLDFGASQPSNSLFVLAFADSSQTLGSGRLDIVNYTGGVDALYIGTTNSLTPAQLSQISFNGLTAIQLSNGEVMAPEPSGVISILVGSGVLGGVAGLRRRRSPVKAA